MLESLYQDKQNIKKVTSSSKLIEWAFYFLHGGINLIHWQVLIYKIRFERDVMDSTSQIRAVRYFPKSTAIFRIHNDHFVWFTLDKKSPNRFWGALSSSWFCELQLSRNIPLEFRIVLVTIKCSRQGRHDPESMVMISISISR